MRATDYVICLMVLGIVAGLGARIGSATNSLASRIAENVNATNAELIELR